MIGVMLFLGGNLMVCDGCCVVVFRMFMVIFCGFSLVVVGVIVI